MDFEFRENRVNPNTHLLYRISISDRLFYIGKAKNASRPRNHYRQNVVKMIEGRPYRAGKPDKFRLIHRRLFEANLRGEKIVIELLRNVSESEKSLEERKEIEKHRVKYGERLLNRT